MTKYTEVEVGARFGRLVTIEVPHSVKTNGRSHTMVTVQCDCGESKLIRVSNLFDGHTRSCGCLQRELTSERRVRETATDREEKYASAGIEKSENDRWCPGCAQFHDISAFGKSKHKSSGLNTYCKEYNRKKRIEKYKENPEKERKASLKYYHLNVDKVKKYRYTYVRIRKEVFERANSKRRALIMGAETGIISAQDYADLLEEYNSTCWICGRSFDIVQLNWDHYQPLVKGGKHSKENLRPSCVDCNRSKHAKWPITEEILEDIRNYSLSKVVNPD